MKKKKELLGITIDDLIKRTFSYDDENKSGDCEKLLKENIDLRNDIQNFNDLKEKYKFLNNDDKELFKTAYKFDQEGDYPNASLYYLLSLMYNPANIKSLINLAIIYYEFNINDRAVELFERVLEIDADNKLAKDNLSVLLGGDQ